MIIIKLCIIFQVLLRLKEQREQLPEYVNQVNLADLLLDVRIYVITIISKLEYLKSKYGMSVFIFVI